MMKNDTPDEFLGQTLKNAGLISFAQIQVALADQEYNSQMRIGEILAYRGWIKQPTADFFADEWHGLVEKTEKYPLGYYLTQADLMDSTQIDSVLQEQKQLWLKFGSVAVLNGFIQQQTLDFFLDSLFPLASSKTSAIGAKEIPQKQEPETILSNEDNTAQAQVDYDDIPWID